MTKPPAANRAHLTPMVVPVKRNGKTVQGKQYFAIGDDPDIELTFDEESSSIGATFETEASRRRRETLLRQELQDAKVQTNTDVWDLVAERTKNGGRYTVAEIEQIMAAQHLTEGMGDLQRNVRVASLAETVSERYPAATFIGYETVCHDELSGDPTWTRQAMILDDNQTVIAVIDERTTDEDSRNALLWALPQKKEYGYKEIDPRGGGAYQMVPRAFEDERRPELTNIAAAKLMLNPVPQAQGFFSKLFRRN